MARKKRIKISDSKTFYHIFSRTAGATFLLNTDQKKEYFIKVMKRLTKFFTIKVRHFVIMSNHFHLIVETCPEKFLSDEEIIQNAKKARLFRSLVLKKEINKLRKKLNDISEFVKLLKQIFAQWYNRTFKRTGYFWGDRFNSIIVQPGIHLLNCVIYILLNPVRANMVKSPEKYKFSSLYFNKYIYKNIFKNQFFHNSKSKIPNFFKKEFMGDKNFIKTIKKQMEKRLQTI